MASVNPSDVPTIYRDEAYKAFMTELPTQGQELADQGFFDLFPEKTIDGYSYYETHVFGSETVDGGRNPGEAMRLRTMGQGYLYATAVRAEFSESVTIVDEYLQTVVKLGDFAAKQGAINARNYASSKARYFTFLLSMGGIVPATLAATGNGAPGQRPRSRIFAQYLKGQAGAILAELPQNDAADPDGLGWFAFKGNEHIRKNGDTTSNSFTGKSEGYYNAGGKGGGNLRFSEQNLTAACLHMENDVSFGPDRVYYAAPMIDTCIVSGNLRAEAAAIFSANEYRLNTPNNDKNLQNKNSGVFKIQNVIVDRYLPDNCWYLGTKGYGVHLVKKSGKAMTGGAQGPIDSSIDDVWYEKTTKTWVNDFLVFWSHMFDSNMDICWFAGSTPTAIANGVPTAPTTASLQDWEG